jgi:hypothetical protein
MVLDLKWLNGWSYSILNCVVSWTQHSSIVLKGEIQDMLLVELFNQCWKLCNATGYIDMFLWRWILNDNWKLCHALGDFYIKYCILHHVFWWFIIYYLDEENRCDGLWGDDTVVWPRILNWAKEIQIKSNKWKTSAWSHGMWCSILEKLQTGMPRMHRHTLHKIGMLLGAYGTVSLTYLGYAFEMDVSFQWSYIVRTCSWWSF